MRLVKRKNSYLMGVAMALNLVDRRRVFSSERASRSLSYPERRWVRFGAVLMYQVGARRTWISTRARSSVLRSSKDQLGGAGGNMDIVITRPWPPLRIGSFNLREEVVVEGLHMT